MSDFPDMPTPEMCSARTNGVWDGCRTMAVWYPQMGGYSGRAIAVYADGCYDVYVWHDGTFPFDDLSPIRLHHCDAEQFIEFGKRLLELAR